MSKVFDFSAKCKKILLGFRDDLTTLNLSSLAKNGRYEDCFKCLVQMASSDLDRAALDCYGNHDQGGTNKLTVIGIDGRYYCFVNRSLTEAVLLAKAYCKDQVVPSYDVMEIPFRDLFVSKEIYFGDVIHNVDETI